MRSPDDGLRALIRTHLPAAHWTTVESGALSPGTPDLEGCLDGVVSWVECKATSGWRVHLRPAQVGWHTRRARAGGRSFVAVRRRAAAGPRRGAAVDELWVLVGRAAPLLLDAGINAPSLEPLLLGRTVGGPARWDWPRVAGWLFD